MGLADTSFLVVKNATVIKNIHLRGSKSTNSIKQSFVYQHRSVYRLINFVSFHCLGSYCYADKVQNTQMIENLSLTQLINAEVFDCMLHSKLGPIISENNPPYFCSLGHFSALILKKI